jgi:hypothetical protein
LLSGYAPSAAAVEAVGEIGRDLQRSAEKKPGSFFWSECLPAFHLSIKMFWKKCLTKSFSVNQSWIL